MIYFQYASVKNSLLLANVKEYSMASSKQIRQNVYDVVVMLLSFFFLSQKAQALDSVLFLGKLPETRFLVL